MRPEFGRYWNTTESERHAGYPAHRYAREPYRCLLRAIDVAAPPAVVYRWLCQLTIAPYSYDWLDNRGRRSPRTLTPGAERLAVGQQLQIGTIVEFEPDRQITFVSRPGPTAVFGFVAMTYQVSPAPEGGTRLLCCVDLTARSLPARFRAVLLSVGDLVMMRRQLLNLKGLAERAVAT